jgi:hypothetical protein
MAYLFIKFPKKFLDSEEWRKPRKYSKAEALLYLLANPELPSIRRLAMIWDWPKTAVADFISYARKQGYLGQISDKSRTQVDVNINELQDSFGQISDKSRTHLIKEIKSKRKYCRKVSRKIIGVIKRRRSSAVNIRKQADIKPIINGISQRIL